MPVKIPSCLAVTLQCSSENPHVTRTEGCAHSSLMISIAWSVVLCRSRTRRSDSPDISLKRISQRHIVSMDVIAAKSPTNRAMRRTRCLESV